MDYFNKINKPYLYFIQKIKFILIIIKMVLFAACKVRKDKQLSSGLLSNH